LDQEVLLAIEALQFNNQPYIELDNSWQSLYQIFNSAQDCYINENTLNKITSKPIITWTHFSHEEFKTAIDKCNNLSTPSLNHISWKHLKLVVKNKKYLTNIVNINNVYITFGHWPAHFKELFSIIISKPNKTLYDSPKIFRPVVLLDTLEKLIEKVIGNYMQFHMISNNYIYSNQLGSLKQWSTTDIVTNLRY